MDSAPQPARKHPPKSPTAPGSLSMLAEISDVLGASKRTCWIYTLRADFPAPVDLVSGGPVWRTSEVERWGKKHLPLPVGRPAAKSKPRSRGG